MITYRPATRDDTVRIAEVVGAALNGLNHRHGFPPFPTGGLPDFLTFLLELDGASSWVADDDGTVIGVSISYEQNRFWFLSHLFIDPARQTKGVGRELIGRTLIHGGGNDADLRALVTLAYNPVSTGLYIQHGMYPLEPVYIAGAPVDVLRRNLSTRETLASEPIEPSDKVIDDLSAIDVAVLGIPRPSVHRFCFSDPRGTCHVFREGGAILGYAHISKNGHIGPAAAVAPLPFQRVIETSLSLAAANAGQHVSLILPGCSTLALSAALECGVRLSHPLLLMASRRFGDLTRYAFYSPGLV